MVNFFDSQFRFTNPVRYFKPNDPIYYEVQNISLKQLQENDLWLKDQVINLSEFTDDGVSRESINELRPYTDGVNNVVKVKPGRFTARINDAYNITPLQSINQVLGDSVNDGSQGWLAAGSNDPAIRTIIDKFKTGDSLDLNGLVERAFTYPAFISDRANTRAITGGAPKIVYLRSQDQDFGQPPYPQAGVVLWNRFQDNRVQGYPGGLPNPLGLTAPDEYAIRQFDDGNVEIGFSRLGAAETAFIKRWRGIARTAIVDIPDELNITIPTFNDQDHFYINESGVKVFLPATQRIDLLFVYSKPVDTSSTTISKFVNGQPTTISEPQLGIVYGAGIGVSFKGYNTRINEVLSPNGVNKDYPLTDDSTLPDGTLKMLSHYGDESGENGFDLSGLLIKGSFPSPDDLMNLSPLLDEELTSSSLFLIGQSVLPLAYIVVRKNSSINLDGTPIITPNDIIDIRPMFRTTELSYNERAGIAAAVPSLSLANPVVTKAEFLYELRRTYNEILTRIPVIEPPNPNTGGGGTTTPTTAAPTPRVVGGGTIFGGYDYGVEGSLAAFILKINPGLSKGQVKQILRQNYGYGNTATIPDQPSWEISKWVQSRGNLLEPGNFPNDRVHLSTMTPSEFGCFADKNKSRRIKTLGAGGWEVGDAKPNWANRATPFDEILTNVTFVKKTIVLDRGPVPWMADYSVNANFINCAPIAGHRIYNSPVGIWVDKRTDRFTIFVAWAGRESFPGNTRGNSSAWGKQPTLDNNEAYFSTSTWLREGNDFAGFIVMNKDLCDYQTALTTNSTISNTNMVGQNSLGVCIYPTIRFEVVGLPEGYFSGNSDFTQFEPTLTLA